MTRIQQLNQQFYLQHKWIHVNDDNIFISTATNVLVTEMCHKCILFKMKCKLIDGLLGSQIIILSLRNEAIFLP